MFRDDEFIGNTKEIDFGRIGNVIICAAAIVFISFFIGYSMAHDDICQEAAQYKKDFQLESCSEGE